MKSKVLIGYLAAAVISLATAGAASATALNIGVGNNGLGPQYLITLNADGSFTTAVNPIYATTVNPSFGVITPNGGGPYDGVEDTYFGVINNSNSVLSSIFLSGPGIFGFDGDGIQTYGVFANNPNDNTGYGGPVSYFNIVDANNGTVIFGPNGIAAHGGTEVFSLEEAVALNTLVVTSGVPEPSTWAMMILGFVGLGFMAYRRKSQASTVSLAA